MSKAQPKKQFTATPKAGDKTATVASVGASKSKSGPSLSDRMEGDMIFGRKNYIWVGIGALLMLIGFVLMTGGAMPSPDVWEPSKIYSATRITVAPILILAGLVVEVYAIFIKKSES